MKKKIKEAKEKVSEIQEGWTNVVFPDEKIEKLAEERRKICDLCPHKKKIMNVEVCGLCNCPLVAKTRTEKPSCPLNKWIA